MGFLGGWARSRPKIRAPSHRLWSVLLILAAVSPRAAIPTGWMPNPAGALSPVPFVVCTAEGARLPAPPGDHAPAKAAKAHEACIFAGYAATPARDPILPGPATAFVMAADQSAFVATEPTPPSRHRDQSPRAPPERV